MGTFIQLEVTGGTSIERACEDAHRIANRLGVSVDFDFNDVRCVAVPDGSAPLLVERQQAEQRRKLTGLYDSKFASSDPRHTPSTKSRDAQARGEEVGNG